MEMACGALEVKEKRLFFPGPSPLLSVTVFWVTTRTSKHFFFFSLFSPYSETTLHSQRNYHCCHSHSHSHSTPAPSGHGHSHSHGNAAKSGGEHSSNMEAVFLHVLADTLGSVGVIVSSLLIEYKGWYISDPIRYCFAHAFPYFSPSLTLYLPSSIFISALIFMSVVPLLRSTWALLMQRVPAEKEGEFEDVSAKIRTVKGVLKLRSFHMWSVTEQKSVVTVAVLRDPAVTSVSDDDIKENVRSAVKALSPKYCTVEVLSG
mmetsp:Transcript_6831/g.17166  ORF Transcript_6831/g.17166 Transcript_6831/m.17166 type:complete len:261 (-) Transcript_6831:1290-2072(-)